MKNRPTLRPPFVVVQLDMCVWGTLRGCLRAVGAMVAIASHARVGMNAELLVGYEKNVQWLPNNLCERTVHDNRHDQKNSHAAGESSCTPHQHHAHLQRHAAPAEKKPTSTIPSELTPL